MGAGSARRGDSLSGSVHSLAKGGQFMVPLGLPYCGRMTLMAPRLPLPERFWRHVVCDIETHCWIWTGSKESKGYGQFRLTHKPLSHIQAHRFAYQDLIGPIPTETLDHFCENKLCVNVLDQEHIQPASNRDNILRSGRAGLLAARSHCEKGHEFNEQNSRYTTEGGRRRRRCLICRRERYHASRKS